MISFAKLYGSGDYYEHFEDYAIPEHKSKEKKFHFLFVHPSQTNFKSFFFFAYFYVIK